MDSSISQSTLAEILKQPMLKTVWTIGIKIVLSLWLDST